MRRVGEVERLHAELKLDPLGDREFAEEAEVPVDDPWPAQGVEA